MALVLTDGTQTPEPSPDEAEENLISAARLLHDKGIDVLVFGIGSNINPFQLLNIASDESNLYVAEVFDQMLDVVGELTSRECLGELENLLLLVLLVFVNREKWLSKLAKFFVVCFCLLLWGLTCTKPGKIQVVMHAHTSTNRRMMS